MKTGLAKPWEQMVLSPFIRAMATGWYQEGSTWYYLHASNGDMVELVPGQWQMVLCL